MGVDIWIVEGTSGAEEYSDRQEWMVGVFFNHDLAEKRVEDCNNFILENHKLTESERKKINPFDMNMIDSFDDTHYFMYPVHTIDDIYW